MMMTIRGRFNMNKLIMVLLAIFLLGCDPAVSTKTHEMNMDMRIVRMSSDSSLSQDKFHNPQLCTAVLLETVEEPIRYAELNNCNNWRESESSLDRIINTPEWLYNHKAGDIVHLNYIRKEKLFYIDPAYRPQP